MKPDENDDLKKERVPHLQDVLKLDRKIRGSFLNHAIGIEYLIGDIISKHFCPDDDRFKLFFSLVINELSFIKKINILNYILKHYYPDLVKKHDTLKSELDKIRNFRNKLVHAMLDSSKEFLDKNYTDRIRIVYYQNGEKKKLTITLKEIDNKLQASSNVLFALIDIQKEVEKRVSEEKD